MFYSHEILTSPQHGVATIWLIATVGPRGGGRKVTRKAIQDVNVRRACEKIIEPGAPIALRLQGNLLYGVSRVYSQQCNYVLTDAEKIQNDMKLFYRLIAQNKTDPQAGKSRREQIVLEDDPNFVPNSTLPQFDIDENGAIFAKSRQPSSHFVFSQLSPLDGSDLSSNRANSIMNFNLPPSDRSSLAMPSPFVLPSSMQKDPLQKYTNPMEQLDDMDALHSIELDIDADGNVLGIIEPQDDIELPDLPVLNSPLDRFSRGQERQGLETPRNPNLQELLDEEGDVPMLDEPPPLSDPLIITSEETQDIMQPEEVQKKAARAAKKKVITISADYNTQLSTGTMKDWMDNYLAKTEDATRDPTKVTISQARLNAFNVVFGQGIGGVGRLMGLRDSQHPLAKQFAGSTLLAKIVGVELSDEEFAMTHGRRRSASEAFDEGDDIEEGRRVRARLDMEEDHPYEGSGAQQTNPELHDMGMIFDDENPAELGRETQPALDDYLSSSLMPWNRTPSVHAPSSVAGSKHRHGSRHATDTPQTRPLHPIERYSDAPDIVPGSDIGLDNLGSGAPSFEEFGPAAMVSTQEAEDSQWMRSAMDTASHEFLDYAIEQAKQSGGYLEGEKESRLWIEFEELAEPNKHTRVVAAQAFLHVLTLATKNKIRLEQDAENNEPFGTIHVGVDVEEQLVHDQDVN